MITTVTARDTELPVTVDEARLQLRMQDGSLDEDVLSKLWAAVGECENLTGRSLRVSTTLTQKYCQWPCNPVRLNRQPVSAITHVKYYDADGTLQTVSSSNYRLHESSEAAAHLEIDGEFVKPTLYARDDAVVVTYTAGYGTTAAVPYVAKEAIKLTLSLLFGALGDRDYQNTLRSRDSLLAQLDPGYYR